MCLDGQRSRRALVGVVLLLAIGFAPVSARAEETATALVTGAPDQANPQDPKKPQKPGEPGAEPVQLKESSESEHTGLKALFFDTVGDFKHFFTDKEPLLWMAGGGATAAAFHPLDDDVNAKLARHDAFFTPGKYIGYGAVQIGAAVGTWAIGRMFDRHGRAAHIGLDLLRAQIVTQSVTYALKYTVQRDRPDGTGGYSFPSGHASTTFATASVLERHFGWKAGIPTYALAAYVATSRLHENRHYLSDVIFGASVGLAAGRTVTRHGRRNFALVPLIVPRGYGVALVRIAP